MAGRQCERHFSSLPEFDQDLIRIFGSLHASEEHAPLQAAIWQIARDPTRGQRTGADSRIWGLTLDEFGSMSGLVVYYAVTDTDTILVQLDTA